MRETRNATSVHDLPAISPERLRLIRLARLLAWSSLAWMTLEGAVAITAGLVAGSIALIGFGIDSAIEGIASVIVVWRFTGSRTAPKRRKSAPRNSWLRASFCWRPT